MSDLPIGATLCSPDVLGVPTMDLIDIFRVLCCMCIVGSVFVIWNRQRAGSLPGPWAIPVVGSLPFLGLRVHATFSRMRKKYGDIFQVQIGCQPVVVLCGLDTIRRALCDNSPLFAGRPKLHTFGLASAGKSMVFNSYGPKWKIHRKLSEHALKMTTGFASGFLENVVAREAHKLVDTCLNLSRGDLAVNPEQAVLWSVAHIKYTLCYGDSRADADFKPMVDNTLQLIDCHNRGNAVNFFPWGKFLFHRNFCRTTDICKKMLSLTVKKEEEHLSSFKDGQVRDALDALIRLGIREKSGLEADRAMHTVQEYIGAGLDIVYTTIHWMILYLANFAEIQAKIRDEVDTVIGLGQEPQVKDSQKMPYSQAFLCELLRHSSVVPFCLPHSTLEATEVDGLHIPKDVFVLVNLFSIHHDAKIWPEPEVFRPERFLTAGGDLAMNKQGAFYPFGMGRRKCVGEKLSMSELFLYLVILVQRTEVVKPAHVTSYVLEPQFGVVLRPKPFHVVFKPR